MENQLDINTFLNAVDTIGTLALLVYMVIEFRKDYKTEVTRHDATRTAYRNDLREVANIRRGLIKADE